ncbi:MAG: hypothetical protein Q8K80_02050 [Methylotenera sp.]|nr:hypothetical protein [Methylotenera sp.]MDP1754296.1 hypothetical protein [Methylotenera sp.]MDP1959807.1 hypothetical protein [Methylotenera sp.]MDP3942643.1 hypothetical protein [Methylotenera sp.]
MHITKQFSHAGKSLILFVIPIVIFVLVGVVEELTGTSLNELKLGYIYEILCILGIALWGGGIIFAFMSFKNKEGHTIKASAGVVLNLVVLLGMLGVFSNYL